MTSAISAKKGDVLILVGTKKGSFLMSSDGLRKDWRVEGPYFPGSDVYHLAYDKRDGGAIFAAINHMIWGPEIQISRCIFERGTKAILNRGPS